MQGDLREPLVRSLFPGFCRASSGLQNLARIHQPLRVENLLDAAHQFQLKRFFVITDSFALELSHAVFGADAAAQFAHHFINQPVHHTFLLRDKYPIQFRIRHRGIVVDVAVAHMPERHDADAGKRVLQCGIGARDEFRHAADRHGYVVLDADAVALLRIADTPAQLPPVFRRAGIGGNGKLRDIRAETLDCAT